MGEVKRYNAAGIQFCLELPAQMEFVAASDYATLHAEVERLRKDAERYRYLREIGPNEDGESAVVCMTDHDGYQVGGQILVYSELDSVVDKAIAEARGRKG